MDRPQQIGSEPAGPERKPYAAPALRVFGPIAAITSQFSRDKGTMDGGPNNLKT